MLNSIGASREPWGTQQVTGWIQDSSELSPATEEWSNYVDQLVRELMELECTDEGGVVHRVKYCLLKSRWLWIGFFLGS